MHEVSKFKTIKPKQQTYSSYFDSKLDIFNIYMSKHTCMNHVLTMKDIKLINMLSKFVTHKQNQLVVLLQNKFKHQSKYLKYIINMVLG
jgi:hypothetical protein